MKNRAALVAKIAAETGLSQEEATTALNSFLAAIRDTDNQSARTPIPPRTQFLAAPNQRHTRRGCRLSWVALSRHRQQHK